MNCFACGAESPLVRERRQLPMGARTVEIEDEFYRCSACGETFYTGGMGDEALRRATAVIRAQDGLLAPGEIVAIRRRYGLTQAQLERLIGAGPKTVVRWERGTVAQNRTADTLLRVLGDHPEVVAQLAEQNGVLFRSAA
jgi:HTH-type transcriptional regulator / antitoxin MqsA